MDWSASTRHVRPVFDDYVTFDEETTVAGQARWGDLPVAAPIDPEEGQALLERGWTVTENEFQRHLDRVKEAHEEHSGEAIMRDADLVRHACHQLGTYRGSSVVLYGILETSEADLIVPADVHY